MRRATFLASVRADFLAILTYIADASGSVVVAETFVRKLRAQCHKLAAINGTIGRARPELRVDIRSFPYKNYVIFFRYVANRFEVVNILERHMDIEAYFSEREEP
ncbi:MAG: type II toxin-antitoxin system RelE/ParE family toxin [Methylocystis sp.]|nr:type II toxin-antitoxin system RelE/ParE family toxin [Methylocystis sp.]